MLSPPPHTLDNGGGGIVGERPGAGLPSAQCSCFALPFLVTGHINQQEKPTVLLHTVLSLVPNRTLLYLKPQ